MSDHPPLPLATSKDLRTVANIVRISGDPGIWHCVGELADRLDFLADALDQLHATPGLEEAIERLRAFALTRDSDTYIQQYDTATEAVAVMEADILTVADALASLAPPGEPEQDG